MRVLKRDFIKVVWLGVLYISSSFAQPAPPIFAIQLTTFPVSALENPLQAAPELETEINGFKGHLAYPLLNSRNHKLIAKLSFRQMRFTYTDAGVLAYKPQRLRELALQLAFVSQIGDNWRLNAFVTPNLASDFENVDGKHLNINAGIVLTNKPGQNSGYGFGAMLNNDFGEPRLLPVLRYWWEMESLRINLVLPRSAEVMLLLGEKAELGIVAAVSGNHYRIGEDVRFGNGESTKNGRIKFSTVSVGPGFSLGLSNGFFFSLEGGVAISRKFELFDSDDNSRTVLDLERSFVLRGGLQLRK